MTISPSSAHKEHNMKPRKVYCPQCNIYWITDEPNPKCDSKMGCGGGAITILTSVVDIDGLAQRTS